MFVNGPIPDTILCDTTTSNSDSTGAIAVFIGKVRGDSIDGEKVKKIEFTCQQQIAESVVLEIIEESKQQFGVLHADVWHSIGTVPVGEICFLVSVLGIHRKESFTALQFIVDEVKSRCPVFGKEILTGRKNRWKENRV